MEEAELYEKSGAPGLYDSLDGETRDLLSQAGVEEGQIGSDLGLNGLFGALSRLIRDEIAAPLKAAASLLAVILLCRLAACLEEARLGKTAALVGALACAGIVAAPLAELIAGVQTAAQAASAFLVASVPVYAGLLAASGSAVTGSSYSLLTLAAGNAIPLLVSGLVLPLLSLFLALALVSAVSGAGLDRLAKSLYGFAKWALVLAVTVFSGFLSIQTALNAQVDAATSKAAKLAVSSAIPIVGSAFGDAIAAIQNSVHAVKSGVGAFGISGRPVHLCPGGHPDRFVGGGVHRGPDRRGAVPGPEAGGFFGLLRRGGPDAPGGAGQHLHGVGGQRGGGAVRQGERMSGVLATVGALCVLLVAVEAAASLCGDSPMVGFVRGLVVTAALLSGLLSLVSSGWGLELSLAPAQDAGEELVSYVEDQALQAAQEELTSYLERLLAAAGLEAEKIQAAADIGEDGSIVCTGVSAWFRYPSDGERAWALLRGVLGEEIRIEVMTDGA